MIFGIIPSYPATGYGYIKAQNQLRKDSLIPNKVENFIEKPNLKTAELLSQNKKFSWNSGMFVFKTSSILKELSKIWCKILTRAQSKRIFKVYFFIIDKAKYEYSYLDDIIGSN